MSSRSSQLSLFPELDRRAFLVVPMDKIEGDRFVGLVRKYEPTVIFDFRRCPSFQVDHTLDRRRAFQVFRECRSSYFDLSVEMGQLMHTTDHHRINAWEDFVARVESRILGEKVLGSVLVLTNTLHAYRVAGLPKEFSRIPLRMWDLAVVES